MKFKTHAAMQSHPDFHVDAQLDPLAFQLSARGSCHATVDAITISVDEIPFRLAIPFLKHRRRPPLLGTVGGVKLVLSPLRMQAEGATVHLEGVVGSKGLSARADGKIGCETEMDMEGQLTGHVGTFKVDLEQDGESS